MKPDQPVPRIARTGFWGGGEGEGVVAMEEEACDEVLEDLERGLKG